MTRLVPPLGEVFFSDRARPADEGSLARHRLSARNKAVASLQF